MATAASSVQATTDEYAHFTFPQRTASLIANSRPSKRLAPGLELRLQRLEEQKRRREAERRRQASIGKIPAEQLAELERLHGQEVIEVRRRGSIWTGPPVRVMHPSGGVRLDGGPVMSEGEASSMLESDASSIISISERLAASDTEEERDALHDNVKYRMPDPGKTRLHLRTKEPLSPTPRSPRRQTRPSAPSTPRSGRGSRNGLSPVKMESPLSKRNSALDGVSDSDFVGSGLSRAGSIYTISRASFTGQLAQLTSMRLPHASSLAKRISSISTSTQAAKVLADAADQIRLWIAKASEVLSGLNAEDDIEWAAAGGREGIEEVDVAITRFEKLVEVYILSTERLQTRDDVAALSSEELTSSVKQMESIMASWHKTKKTLDGVKEQVEIAMEWQELWNSVLGEICQEMEGLNRLVFEMEEKRHHGVDTLLHSRDSIDLAELETIVEERPARGGIPNSNRFSFPPFSPSSPLQPSATPDHDDSSLLALFARMQPLRASLQFLPMRLSSFHIRGNPMFPTACLDLEQRRDQLEEQWRKLEADADSLRRELGEDRWVLVFRNAGRQALKMCESISRSYGKLRAGVDGGEYHSCAQIFDKKAENYEAKKLHYGPAIERVLAIIDRGVLDRLTVNGEILRLQSDMRRRWSALQANMRDMDLVLEDLNSESRDRQLRESISTVMSSERSNTSSIPDTPGSSPASSVLGMSRQSSLQGSRTPTPYTQSNARKASLSASGAPRPVSRVPSASAIPQRIPLSRSLLSEYTPARSSSPLTPHSLDSSGTPPSNRPRWVSGRKTESRDFLPLSALEPSPYAKAPITPRTNFLRSATSSSPLSPATHSPLLRNVSTPASMPRSTSSLNGARKSSLPVSASYSAKSPASSPLVPKSAPTSQRPLSRVNANRRSSMLARSMTTDGNDADSESPSHHRRSPSVLSNDVHSVRTRSRLGETAHGSQESKPRWRG